MRMLTIYVLTCLLCVTMAGRLTADDWTRFRGPNGSGIAANANVPESWSESKNLAWKTPLPGPGSSSPIVLGNRVFVTCYSGYGVEQENAGSPEDLRRHLLCINRRDGKVIWSKSVEAVLPEDPYRGNIREHGYASHSPVTDGQHLYVFFGKTGVLAFDLEGNKLWQASVGTESGRQAWGSAASPILYKNLVIVTASEESQALVALEKSTGKEVWRAEASGFAGTWGTPVLVGAAEGKQELVISVPFEIWGFSPDNGKLLWYAETELASPMCASVIAGEGVVYALGGRQGGSTAIRTGGKGDVAKTHVLWSGRQSARIGTPVLQEGRLYWISQGIAHCVDAKTGESVYQERLSSSDGAGRRRGRDYGSMVLAGGKVYAVTRSGDTFVVAAEPEFKQLALNHLSSDGSDFSATPAVSGNQLLIRSNRFLYCLQADDSQ